MANGTTTAAAATTTIPTLSPLPPPSTTTPVPLEWADSISEILLPSQVISERVKQMSEILRLHYEKLNPLLVVILKGSFLFAADLSRSLQFEHEVEFIRARSYSGTASSGNVKLYDDEILMKFSNRHVLIIEDIVDTGLTLQRLYKQFHSAGAKSIKCCTLLEKITNRRSPNTPIPDFVAFSIPDKFVVGYGLDHDQRFRHLPFVGVYKQ